MSDEEKPTVTLRLPSALSAYSGGKSQIVLKAKTVEEMLTLLGQLHPPVWQHLCTEQGHIREHVKIFVNNEMISGHRDWKRYSNPARKSSSCQPLQVHNCRDRS